MGMWFTDSWESVVNVSPITPNANFVETYMFLDLQEHQALKIYFDYTISMFDVDVCTIKY